MRKILFIFLLMPAILMAQTQSSPDVWQSVRFLAGKLLGQGEGEAGLSSVEREYHFILNDKFLHGKNKSVYAPQEKNPTGEVHENWDFFSYDKSRQTLVLRQFHVEEFVNQYVLDKAATGRDTLRFVTESIENISSGWRASETYVIVSDNEFKEIFELAAPGKEFEVFTVNRFKRSQ